MARIGHNSGGIEPSAAEDLRHGIERVERLLEEKKGIADDILDVFREYKSKGFDTKMMRQIIKIRAMKPEDRREMEELLEVYKLALGIE